MKTPKQKHPLVIRSIVDQLGAGIGGAMCYVGAQMPTYTYPSAAPRDQGVRPSYPSNVTRQGAIIAEISLTFKVNANRDVRISISYEQDDTYTVRLWQAATNRTKNADAKAKRPIVMGKILFMQEQVYCDDLATLVEGVYDNYINEHQSGVISM